MDNKISKLRLDLKIIYTLKHPGVAYNTFSQIIYQIFVKNNRTYFKVRKEQNPWLTKAIITSIKIRNKLIRKKNILAKIYRSKIKHYINILRENYYKEKITDNKNNVKQQWSLSTKYLKADKKDTFFTGNIISLNSHFANIGSKLSSSIPYVKIEYKKK